MWGLTKKPESLENEILFINTWLCDGSYPQKNCLANCWQFLSELFGHFLSFYPKQDDPAHSDDQ